MSTINLVGLAENDPIPGNYIEINFAQGDIASFAGARRVLLLGNKTPAGSATVDTVVYGPDTQVRLSRESDAIALFGEGSELHRMYRMFTAVNKTTPVYALAVAEDGTATAGTATVTITNTATGFGTLRIWMDDEYVDTGFASGDTPTNIADTAVDNFNAKSQWGSIASNVAGVITLTSKNKSTRANLHKYAAQILESGTGVSVTPLATTAFVNGTVADDVTDALATLSALNQRFDYIVAAHVDQTNLEALAQFVDDQAAAVVGLRQRLVFGSTDTLASAIVITTALNAARCEMVWQAGGVVQPAILAAHNSAVYMLEEAATIPRLNFSNYGTDARTQPTWRLKPARETGDLPTRTEIKSALNSGVTPVVNGSFGATYLVKRITTRWLNGAVADYRIRDAHKVTVCDRYADDLIAKFSAQFTGKQIANDPQNEEPFPNQNTVTPAVVGGTVNKLTLDYGAAGLVQNVDAIIKDTVVVRETSPSTRMSVQVPLQPIDILDQLAVQVNQVA